MTTLQHILSTAHSGMTAAQATVASASRNISNANTPGYAHEVLPLIAQLGGLAVSTGSPYGVRNVLLERGLAATASRLGFYDGQLPYLQVTEIATNDLDGNGLGISMRDFETSLSALAANPASMTDRTQALQSARTLGAAFAVSRERMSINASDVARQAESIASTVNGLAAEVAQLNQRIRAASPGEDRNSLLARRSAVIQELSTSVGVDAIPHSDGTVTLMTASGRPLVDSTFPSHIQVNVSAPPDSQLDVVMTRDNGSTTEPLHLGGKLGGLVEFYNDVAIPAIQRVDEMAYSFMDAFNQAHRAGFNLNGGTGYDFFEQPASVSGAAAAMNLSRDVDGHPENIGTAIDPAGIPGDNTNAITLQGILSQSGVMADGSSVMEAWEALGTTVSAAVIQAAAGASLEQGSYDQLSNMLAVEEGVSIDEELIRVTTANTALEASNTVLQQLQTMTDTILAMVG